MHSTPLHARSGSSGNVSATPRSALKASRSLYDLKSSASKPTLASSASTSALSSLDSAPASVFAVIRLCPTHSASDNALLPSSLLTLPSHTPSFVPLLSPLLQSVAQGRSSAHVVFVRESEEMWGRGVMGSDEEDEEDQENAPAASLSSSRKEGVFPAALDAIFAANAGATVRLSLFDLAGKESRDYLAPSGSAGVLLLRNDAHRVLQMPNLVRRKIDSAADGVALVSHALRERVVDGNDIVVSIQVDQSGSSGAATTTTLQLYDIHAFHQADALNEVVASLASGSSAAAAHVFRKSNLTRLLKEALSSPNDSACVQTMFVLSDARVEREHLSRFAGWVGRMSLSNSVSKPSSSLGGQHSAKKPSISFASKLDASALTTPSKAVSFDARLGAAQTPTAASSLAHITESTPCKAGDADVASTPAPSASPVAATPTSSRRWKFTKPAAAAAAAVESSVAASPSPATVAASPLPALSSTTPAAPTPSSTRRWAFKKPAAVATPIAPVAIDESFSAVAGAVDDDCERDLVSAVTFVLDESATRSDEVEAVEEEQAEVDAPSSSPQRVLRDSEAPALSPLLASELLPPSHPRLSMVSEQGIEVGEEDEEGEGSYTPLPAPVLPVATPADCSSAPTLADLTRRSLGLPSYFAQASAPAAAATKHAFPASSAQLNVVNTVGLRQSGSGYFTLASTPAQIPADVHPLEAEAALGPARWLSCCVPGGAEAEEKEDEDVHVVETQVKRVQLTAPLRGPAHTPSDAAEFEAAMLVDEAARISARRKERWAKEESQSFWRSWRFPCSIM